MEYDESLLLDSILNKINTLKDMIPQLIVSNSENAIIESKDLINPYLDDLIHDICYLKDYEKNKPYHY